MAIVAVTAAGGVAAWQAGASIEPLAYIGVFTLVIAGWVVSLSLHEFAHAFTAWRFGDHGVAMRGYLTLNPLKYTHPVLSLLLPIIFIALGGIGVPGGAVYVRTDFMTKWQKTIVSLAGPFTNILFAAILLVVTAVFYDPDHMVFWAGLAFSGFLQVTAVLLNLLPVPGLDGYSALEPHLSAETRRALEPAKQWGLFLLLVLFIATPLSRVFFDVVGLFIDIAGVDRLLVGTGLRLTQFWSAWL